MTHEAKNKYLFEYTYDGAEWIGEVWADNPDDAQRKIMAMGKGTLSGQEFLQVKVPSIFYRIWLAITGK